MKIRTAVTDILGIDLPIIGAPMFLVSYPDLVTAVSEAPGGWSVEFKDAEGHMLSLYQDGALPR